MSEFRLNTNFARKNNKIIKQTMIKKSIFLMALMCSASAWSQTWTLSDCIEHALQNNISILKNRVNEESGEATLKQNKSVLWPSLSFSTSHGVNFRPGQVGTTSRPVDGELVTTSNTTANSSYGINMNWTVWNGGINYKNVEAQKVNNEISELATEASELNIQEQIVQLYVQIMYTKEAVKVNEALVKTAQEQYNRGQHMFNEGQMSQADLVQLEAQLASAKYDVVNSGAQVQNYYRQLKSLLQLDMNVKFQIGGEIPSDDIYFENIPEAQAVYEQALLSRPEIRSAEKSIESAELQYNIAKRGYYPTIGVNAGISDSHNTGNKSSVGKQMKNNLNMSASVNLSVPIWDQRRTATNKQKALLQKTSAQLDLEDKKKSLSSTIEQFWINATSAQVRFASAKAKCKSQEASYALVNEQFQNGLKSVVDVLQSRDNILAAEQDKLQSKYTLLLNIQMLKFYQGEELDL